MCHTLWRQWGGNSQKKTPGNVRDMKVDLQLYANDTLEQQTRFDPE